MKNEDFERLKHSVIEAGQVLRGERQPIRETVYEVRALPSQSRLLAVCVATDEPELLIPRKIYELVVVDGKYARVIDETGEAAVYPADFFLPLSLSQEIESTLAKVA